MKRFLLRFLTLAALIVVPWGGYFNQVQAQQSLPYSYGFENNNLATDGWLLSGATSDETGISSDAAQNGSYGFAFYYSEQNAYLLSPIFTDNTAALSVTFSYTEYSDTYGDEQFYVGYTTDASNTDPTTYTYGAIVTASTSWQEYENSFPAGTKRIAIKYVYNDCYYLYLDDFTFEVPAACAKPTAFTAGSITATGATLTWTAGGSETDWVVEYGTASDFTGAVSTTATGTPTKNLTGLTAQTTYYARVKAVCGVGDESNWTSTSFTTACVAITYFPWNENFDALTANTVPNCWDNSASTSSTLASNPERIWGVYEYSGNKMLRMYNYYVQSGTALINTPPIELTGDYQLTFNYSHRASCGAFAVKISTDGGSSFTELQTYTSTASTDQNNPGEFTEATLDLSAYNGETVILQFFSTANYGSGAIFLDNISVAEPPSCVKPTTLAAGSISSDAATLTWTAGGSETDWVVEYGTASDFAGATEENVSTPTLALTGLTPTTTYYVRVKADCGGGDESDWTTVSFTTACAAIAAVGYTQNFDALTTGNNVLPLCWSYINTTSYSYYQGYPKAYNSTYHSASNCLYFNSYYYSYSDYDPQPQYAILPPMTDLNGTRVTLWARGYNANSTFKIGTMTDPTDDDTFTLIEEQALTTTYQQFEYIVPATTDHYLAIMIDAANSSRTSNGVYIDDIVIDEAPTCTKPTALAAGSISSDAATLTWTAGGSETDWAVEYGTASDFTGAVSEYVTTPTLALTSLTPATTYYVRVKADCGGGDESDWSTAISFTTTCVAIDAFPWSENFDALTANTVPNCWDNSASTSSTLASYPERIWGVYEYSGNKMLRMYNYYVQSGTALINTPPIELSGAYQLTFNYSHRASCGAFAVKISTDGGSSFTELQTYTSTASTDQNNPGEFTEATLDLSAYTGVTVILQFFSTADYSSGAIFLDNISVTACVTPTGLAYDNLQAEQVELSWTSTASAWDVAYKADGDPDFTVIENVSDNPYTLDGLSAETDYNVRIRSNCGGDGVSEWTSVVAFTTLAACAQPFDVTVTGITSTGANVAWSGNSEYKLKYRLPAVIDPVLSEGFESGIGEWSMVDCDGSTGVSTEAMHSGSNGFKFRYNTTPPQYLVSPEMSGLTEGAKLEFYYKNSSSSYPETFHVGTSTSAAADAAEIEANFTFGEEITASDQQWHLYSAVIPAGTKYICIKLTSNDQLNLYIDDIVVGNPVGAGSWTEVNTGSTASHTITGLTAATKYEVVVEAQCGTYPTSDPVFFTTQNAVGKSIEANKWYVIASPVHDDGTTIESFAKVQNLTSGTYDLMGWDESNGTWESSKPSAIVFFVRGQGYIYRRSTAADLSFVGYPNTGTFSTNTYYLSYACADNTLKGFNLLGNPYTKAYTPTRDYYKLQPNGTWSANASGTGSVAVGEGFLVKVTGSYTTYNFVEPSGAKSAPRNEAAMLAFTVSNGEYSDMAYARFADGEGLAKFPHLTSDAPSLSISLEGQSYAIADLADDAESFEMAFSGNGDYTLAVSGTTGFGYLHLIDHATGSDIDLLHTRLYTFSANGPADRFTVKLRPGSDAGSDSFVRLSGTNLVVFGDGLLQVFDVMGRQLGKAQVSGTTTLDRASLGIYSAGVYLLRLNGMTQKIVVK